MFSFTSLCLLVREDFEDFEGGPAAEPVRGQDDGRRNCRVCEAEGESEGETERDPHEKKAGQP